MKLIVGLGNPGSKYQNNRHNVGHIFIAYLIEQLRITDYGFKIYRTDCYMNESGKFVKKIIRNSKFTIKDLIVVHDDLDIPLGKFRIDFARGPKLHNGIESIENELGTKDFWRIRIGVDNRLATGPMNGESYVLNDFRPEEKTILTTLFPEVKSHLIRLKLH